MSPRVRVIRFARTEPDFSAAGGERVARVFVDEGAAPAGIVLRAAGRWEYTLTGESAPVLTAPSRRDIERQIALFHLGELPAESAGESVSDRSVFATAV